MLLTGDSSGSLVLQDPPETREAAPAPAASARAVATEVQGPTVFVRDNFYAPATLRVPVGSTVRWDHQGRVEHTITSQAGYFDSGVISNGDVFTYTFDKSGRYDYFCRFHFTARGVVIVQ